MDQRKVARIAAPALGAVVLFSGLGLTSQGTAAEAVAAARVAPSDARTTWIRHNAHRLATTDPHAPIDDLAPLRRSVGNAEIVGLGEPAHGLKEITTLKHRTLRYLVERMGFRSIAWEDDWTLGLEINEYIRTGKGDVTDLLNRTSGAWRNGETADVLNWLRDFNKGRPEKDKVRFVGTEYFTTWKPAYDNVTAYVAEAAPSRLPELREHLRELYPKEENDTAFKHAIWYMGVTEKEPYVRQARQVYELVKRLPHRPGDKGWSLAEHSARQIRSFYEHYSMSDAEIYVYRDARAAENLRWWRGYDDTKVVYWAATPHSAVAPGLRVTLPPGPDMAFASVGSYLGRWYGTGYRSIGFTFDHGTVPGDNGTTIKVPPPEHDWFERPFGEATRSGQLVLDLRSAAPPAIRQWLRSPIRIRGFADHTPEIPNDSYATGGTPEQWFDVIVHRQTVTPARPLT